jgi:hypothetical protein
MVWQAAADTPAIVQAWAAVIELVVVTASVILIWYQLMQQTKLTKAANVQALVNTATPFNLLVAQDDGFADLWRRGPAEFGEFNAAQKIRYENGVIWHLMFHENVFLQNQNKLLDNYMYAAWNADLRKFVRRQNLEQHWEDMKIAYHVDFRAHIDALMRSVVEE